MGVKEDTLSTKNTWRDEVVGVGKLKLDLQNPRLPKYVKDVQDANSIRDYLLNKEGITRIARSIANNGYHHSAVSIAYEDTDGKYVVLDGNRRLAACQLLETPALALDAKTRKQYETLAKDMDAGALSSIKVTVAPSRKAAEKEIWDIHVTPSSKPWEVLQKLRMYRNLIETGDYDVPSASQEYGMSETKFKTELSKLYLYEQMLEHTDDKGQEELINSGFNKIQRVLLSKNGQMLLDFSVGDNGRINISDADKFDKNLTSLTPYIVEPNRVPAQATQDDLIDTVYSKIDPALFPPKKTTTPKVPAKPKKSTKSPAGTVSKANWVTDAEYRQYAGAERVKNILEELKKNEPERSKNLNMVSITLRVVIELAIYDVLQQKGHIKTIINSEKARIRAENTKRVASGKPILPNLSADWAPTLGQMLDFMLDQANRVITDPQERRALGKIRTSRKNYVDNLNSFIHNVSYKPTADDTKDIWDTFGRPMFDIIKKI